MNRRSFFKALAGAFAAASTGAALRPRRTATQPRHPRVFNAATPRLDFKHVPWVKDRFAYQSRVFFVDTSAT